MNKILSFVFLLCIAVGFLSFPVVSYAHFAATDGTITVTLHVDPNDDPIPRKLAYVYFLFKFNNGKNKFKLDQCKCIVIISEQGKQIIQQKLSDNQNVHSSVWGANMPVVFPAKDVYFISIKGDPMNANTFKPFYLSWSFRVDTTNPGIVKQKGLSDIQVLVSALVVGLIILFGIGVFLKEQVLSVDHIDSRKKH